MTLFVLECILSVEYCLWCWRTSQDDMRSWFGVSGLRRISALHMKTGGQKPVVRTVFTRLELNPHQPGAVVAEVLWVSHARSQTGQCTLQVSSRPLREHMATWKTVGFARLCIIVEFSMWLSEPACVLGKSTASSMARHPWNRGVSTDAQQFNHAVLHSSGVLRRSAFVARGEIIATQPASQPTV